MKTKLEHFFKMHENHTHFQTEVYAGLTGFFTLIYFIFLVPTIVMEAFPGAYDEAGHLVDHFVLPNGLTEHEMLLTLTIAAILAAVIGTLITAFWTNKPFAQGPSVAIATFITYNLCIKQGYTYEQALAAVFVSGIVFFILTMLGLEKKIRAAIPRYLKNAITVGVGILLAFMGMQKCHMVVEGHHLVEFVKFAGFNDYNSMSTILCIIGLIIIVVMHAKHIHGAILYGKIIVIIAAVPLGLFHHGHLDLLDYNLGVMLPTAFKMDFAGFFTHGGIMAAIGVVIALCLMNIIEVTSAVIATDHVIDNKVHDEGENKDIKKVFEADALATVVGSAMGVTSVTTYIENTSIAAEGGRTGFSGVVTALLFILAIFIAPYASSVPSAATATTLIITGVFMMTVIKDIDFHEVEEGLPAFFTIALIPLTYNLFTGVAVGIISHTLIFLLCGHGKKINKGTYILTILFILMFFLL